MIRTVASGMTLLALVSVLSGCFGGNRPLLSETGRRIQDMNERALASVEISRFDDARTLLDEALRLATSLDDAEQQALTLLNLARLERRLGRLEQAELLLGRALGPVAPTSCTADLMQEMALLRLAQNKPADALGWAEKALREEQGTLKGRRLNLLARIALLQGRNADADRLAEQALSHTDTVQMAEERANTLRIHGEITSANNRLDDAERLLLEALGLDRAQERPAKIAADLEALAKVMKLKNDTLREKDYLQRAQAVRESMKQVKRSGPE